MIMIIKQKIWDANGFLKKTLTCLIIINFTSEDYKGKIEVSTSNSDGNWRKKVTVFVIF